MDGSYASPIQPLAAFYPIGHAPIMPPHPDVYNPAMQHLQSMVTDDLSIGYDFDPSAAILTSPQSESRPRQRRRTSQGPDHIKHRRTRSGCYTCRQRRVKCDEARPICDRCRKGARDCVYPTTNSASKADRSAARRRLSLDGKESSGSSDESNDDTAQQLAPIPDDEDYLDENEMSESWRMDHSDSLDAVAPSPNAYGSSKSRRSRRSSVALPQSKKWAALPRDVKIYLRYYKEHMSHHHYAFKFDRGDFMKSTLVEIAMKDDSRALLHAIVAFAAYHHTVSHDDLKLSPFLSYYNSSIVLLQQSLKTRKPTTTTLLTILQLASIEEYLGDWVNLIGHQRAAYQILTELFTPETIVQDSICRHLINWYIRFDLFAGIMSGGETKLGREWFAACQKFYRQQTLDNPDDPGWKFDDLFATCRLMATDVTLVVSEKAHNKISDHEFLSQVEDLRAQFKEFEKSLATATVGLEYIKEFPTAPPPHEDDITDYHDPNFIYGGDHFPMNFVLMDFLSLDLMFKHQINSALHQQNPTELTDLALKKCKLFEALQYCEDIIPGTVFGSQAGLAYASIFLPKDEKHTMWCRRKFAVVERRGYIYPSSFRKRMSELWNVDVTLWWLPEDEDYPQTIRALRDFIDYRARVPEDAMSAHVRDLTGIFRILGVEETDENSVLG